MADSNLRKISIVIGIIVSCGIIVGVVFAIDDRWAKNSEFQMLVVRVDYKFADMQIDTMQQRIWKLEDRYEEKPMPQSVKEEIRMLEMQKNKIIRKMKEHGDPND